MLPETSYEWLPPVAMYRGIVSVRVGLKRLVTLQGVAVGLNGGFVHIAQLGANRLSGVECQAWYEKPQP